jgi:hypothetical protein
VRTVPARRLRRRTGVGILAVVLAFASHGARAQGSIEAALHAALIREPVLVDPAPIAVPAVAYPEDRTRPGRFDVLPAALRDLLTRGAEARGTWSADDFSPPAVVGTKAQIDAFVASRSTGRGGAASGFPAGTTAVVRLSRALVAPDRLDAIIYAESFCGNLCGEGSYVWLHRDNASTEWRERKRIMRWVS